MKDKKFFESSQYIYLWGKNTLVEPGGFYNDVTSKADKMGRAADVL